MGILSTLRLMAVNMLWPRMLGGTPREYIQVTGAATPETLTELARLVEEGSLRVHVGASMNMEDAQKVCSAVPDVCHADLELGI